MISDLLPHLREAAPIIGALIIIEGLLSVDNILAIAALASELPEKQRKVALRMGLAGAYLALAQNANFSPNMTAGRGYIALAAMIFGRWRVLPTLGACLLFGLLDAMAIRLQGVALPGIGEVPVQLIQALPYLLTVILLAGFIGQAVAPKALAKPYVKER